LKGQNLKMIAQLTRDCGSFAAATRDAIKRHVERLVDDLLKKQPS
jgi:hypothetical protein